MNLIEAVRTGRRFKRPRWLGYWQSIEGLVLTTEDVLATDYILEEDPKPKRRLYIGEDRQLIVTDNLYILKNWTPLSRKEFEALFEGDE